MIRYNAVEDPLCYPGTHVLRNKADIEDQDQLDQFEQLMFDSRATEALPEGSLDFAHYQALHHHFFQDVYDWAGNIRSIRTGKGDNWFCYPEYIEPETKRLFAQLASPDISPKPKQGTPSLKAPHGFWQKSMQFIHSVRVMDVSSWSSSRC